MRRRFRQVDVFGSGPCSGNPVGVLLDAEGLTSEQMQRLARWANLSETTFLVPPTRSEADYRVRIFTPVLELPFAGHPTLGSCHAWLQAGNKARNSEGIVQECGAGLIRIRRADARLAFAAPPLLRSGPASKGEASRAAAALGLDPDEILAVEWVDNGPGWLVVLIESADRVLRLRPASLEFPVGIVGFYPPGSPAQIEVRGFTVVDGRAVEDPVTGSLNASVAQWLLAEGRLQAPYLATQGAAIDRAGRIRIDQDGDGTIWVGGRTETVISGIALSNHEGNV